MSKIKEAFKRLSRIDQTFEKVSPPDENRHYSQKGGHADRSEKNSNGRKRSPRRRGGRRD
jgi:hypothetical protein